MPRKRIANTIAAQVSVVRAFFHSGGLKAGTPSLIASTPVSATAPWLNARRMRNSPSACVALLDRLPRGRRLELRARRRAVPATTP